MTTPRPLTARAMREAAQVARQEGVTIVVTCGARVYQFAPAGQDATPKAGGDEWEEAFDSPA